MKRILIFGGSGFVGGEVVAYLSNRFDIKVVEHKTKVRLSKESYPKLNQNRVEVLPLKELDIDAEVAQADIVINFSGANIATQAWSEKRKKVLRSSRIDTTRRIRESLEKTDKEILFINASAIGYYGFGDDVKTESSPPGNDFLSQLCQEWESEVIQEKTLSSSNHSSKESLKRSLRLRLGLVLGREGGAIKPILLSTRMFLGAVVGSGNQLISWIYVQEIPRLLEYLIDHREISGAINLTTPNPVTFRGLMQTLGKALRRPILLKVPSFIIKLLLGERSCLLLESANVHPKKLLDHGYVFEYPTLDRAFQDMLK